MAEQTDSKPDWRASRKKRIEVALTAFALKIVFRLICLTMRWRREVLCEADVDNLLESGGIIAVYHGEHFPSLYTLRNRDISVIASHSADGELLAQILHSFGFKTVRGSSSRGGARALIDLTRILRTGNSIAIAVDGPRGPRHEVKPGTILAAKLSGKPILPTAASATRYWQIKSWDRFRIPKPFSAGLVMLGEPITVPKNATDEEIERYGALLKERLDQLQTRCDDAVGGKRDKSQTTTGAG